MKLEDWNHAHKIKEQDEITSQFLEEILKNL